MSQKITAEDLFANAKDVVSRISVSVGKIKVRFEWKPIGQLNRSGSPSERLAGAVGNVTVTIVVPEEKRTKQTSAQFSPAEVVSISGDQWPNEDNIANICKSVRDRGSYPLLGTQEPSDRSQNAQGQTKKPGAHSEARHR